jgi:hypothetical protein
MVACISTNNAKLYRSRNYGASWEETSLSPSSGKWFRSACITDSNYIVVAEYDPTGGSYTGYMIDSSNNGVNWNRKTTHAKKWLIVNSSNDGSRFIVSVQGNGHDTLYRATTSTSGLSGWSQVPGSNKTINNNLTLNFNAGLGHSATAISNDGNKIFASVNNNGGLLYTFNGTNGNPTWKGILPVVSTIYALSLSGDESTLVVGLEINSNSNDSIYVYSVGDNSLTNIYSKNPFAVICKFRSCLTSYNGTGIMLSEHYSDTITTDLVTYISIDRGNTWSKSTVKSGVNNQCYSIAGSDNLNYIAYPRFSGRFYIGRGNL